MQAIVSDQSATADDIFGEIEEACNRNSPQFFNEELIDISRYPTAYVSDDGSIVSFSRIESAPKAFSNIADELRAKGWVFVESGSQITGSFVKSSGYYRWAFVSCVSVSGQTSVVIQTVPIDEEALGIEEEG